VDPTVAKLKTPAECLRFEKNALDRSRPDLAQDARRRAIELRAENYGAKNDVEKECLEAIYAYERVLTQKHGRTITAARTWPMVKKYGIIEAVERVVLRPDETVGYTSLLEMGLQDYAFEAVVLRHPEHFSEAAVKQSQLRTSE